MKKVKSVKTVQTKFSRKYDIEIGNFTITKGDIIKINGEHGVRFMFDSHCYKYRNWKCLGRLL